MARRTAQLTAIQEVTTLVMASPAETRDSETSNHIRRTQHYVKALAWRLSTHPRFAPALTPKTIELLHSCAALHDIGKAGIPDRILLKPGKLSPDEFEIMKTHTTLGHDAIAYAKRALGIIQQTRGRHFDPDVVDAFLAVEDKFKAIAIAYADSHADLRKKVDYIGIAQV